MLTEFTAFIDAFLGSLVSFLSTSPIKETYFMALFGMVVFYFFAIVFGADRK